VLWGHSHSFGSGLTGWYNYITVPLLDSLRNRRRYSAYRLDNASLRKYYDDLAVFRPRSLYAYASAGHLLACANRGRPPLPLPLKAAFLAAEPVLESYKSAIREVFRCPAVGEYGSIECGMIAYEHPEGGYRVFQRAVIVETEEDGQGVYKILVTQLRDTGFPLLRYEIGDITSEPLSLSVDGQERLHTIVGRSHDLILPPSAKLFHGELITHILEHIPEVVLFNIHQDMQLVLHFYVRTDNGQPLSGSQEKWIKQSLLKAIGEEMEVEIISVPHLERTVAGKLRWITSEPANKILRENNELT